QLLRHRQRLRATPTFDRPGAPPAAEREPAEQILGRALAGRRDDVVPRDQIRWTSLRPRGWAVTPICHPTGRTQPPAPRHGLHRRLLCALPRPEYSPGPDPLRLRRRLGATGQAALRRLVELSGVASHPRLSGSPTSAASPHRCAHRSSTTSLSARRRVSWSPPVPGSDCPSCRSVRCTADYWPTPKFSKA